MDREQLRPARCGAARMVAKLRGPNPWDILCFTLLCYLLLCDLCARRAPKRREDLRVADWARVVRRVKRLARRRRQWACLGHWLQQVKARGRVA